MITSIFAYSIISIIAIVVIGAACDAKWGDKNE